MIRVFPRKTCATPTDDKVYFSGPPLWPLDDKEVSVSCTFTWDRNTSRNLADLWNKQGYNVTLGGPGFDDPGGEFVPGRFLSKEYVITSRGCNNRCWFCSVPNREGTLRELPIRDGWRVQDNNLLQCSEGHIRAVFEMLRRQPIPVSFVGGLEAAQLADWHVDLLKSIKLSCCFFAYDTAEDYEPLLNAAKKLRSAGFSRCVMRCYCLIGYMNDTFEKATQRLEQCVDLGFLPHSMLYCDEAGFVKPDWTRFHREWASPQIVAKKYKERFGAYWRAVG